MGILTLRGKTGGPGYGSEVVNGQLVNLQTRDAWQPVAYGPTPGFTGTVSPVPVIPPAGAGGVRYGAPSAMYGMGGGGDAANGAAAQAAAAQPFNFKLSPLPWAILFLGGGLLLLRFVHWRG